MIFSVCITTVSVIDAIRINGEVLIPESILKFFNSLMNVIGLILPYLLEVKDYIFFCFYRKFAEIIKNINKCLRISCGIIQSDRHRMLPVGRLYYIFDYPLDELN